MIASPRPTTLEWTVATSEEENTDRTFELEDASEFVDGAALELVTADGQMRGRAGPSGQLRGARVTMRRPWVDITGRTLCPAQGDRLRLADPLLVEERETAINEAKAAARKAKKKKEKKKS